MVDLQQELMQQESLSQRSKSWIKASIRTLKKWSPRDTYIQPKLLRSETRKTYVTWPAIVITALIHECKNDTPILVVLVVLQQLEEDSMGPKTQYENADVKIIAGKLITVLNAFLIPSDAHIVINAWKI